MTERSAPTVDAATDRIEEDDDRHAHRAAGVTRRAAEGRNRILPSPVTGQELVLIGVIAVHLGRSSRWPPRRS